MSQILRNQSLDQQRILSYGDSERSYCNGWYGIRCLSGEVIFVEMTLIKIGNLALEYAPNTVQVLRCYGAKQSYHVDTRLLPRDLRKLEIQRNMIHGALELRTLPRDLRLLKDEQNQIIGPIYLTNLPPNIVSIELQSNLIVQDILIYTKLPQSVSLIDISDGNRTESSFFLDEFGSATQRDKAQVQKEKIWT